MKRFSLQSLLFLVTVAALASAVLASLQENRRLRRQLEERTKKCGLVEFALLREMKDHLTTPAAAGEFSRHGIAKEVAIDLAPSRPNDNYIWWVLIQTGALHDGIHVDDAIALLGTPMSPPSAKPGEASESSRFLEWYDAAEKKPLRLRAKIEDDRLSGWITAYDFFYLDSDED